jgi:hypothetical protein
MATTDDDARRVPCPECHQTCGWCSIYKWQVREIGCGLLPRALATCRMADGILNQPCGTCDGSARVISHLDALHRIKELERGAQ